MTRPTLRLEAGGQVKRDHPLNFTFNGKRYTGLLGDTLASALLANGVHFIGRSFKYHRPRGIMTAGADEPNALVQLEHGAHTEPNIRATQLPLYEGLSAASQNAWPSLSFDLGALNRFFSRLLPSGFYYKTFMWPRKLWPLYENVIRKAAGMGRSARLPDPDHYEHKYAHCDVLIVGGGPTGLTAALAAARSGARVMLAEQDHAFGGSLLNTTATLIDGVPALHWIKQTLNELKTLPDVTLIPRGNVFGYFDHNALTIAEQLPIEQLRKADTKLPRQRLWKVRAQQVVLATGAHERPLVFGNNDLPGVMLASAARTYLNRYAVKPGTCAVIFTNNDSAYVAALDMKQAGVTIAAIIDVRRAASADLLRFAAEAGIPVRLGNIVLRAHGGRRVTAVTVAEADEKDATGTTTVIACDLVCMSGGFSPVVHLHSQAKGSLRYEDRIAAFVPDKAMQAHRSAGAANGQFTLADCLVEGAEAGVSAAQNAGFEPKTNMQAPKTIARETPVPLQPLWEVRADRSARYGKAFVDFQNDVTSNDVALAAREGYVSVEHLKRYTTLGMGTDQGKTSNINGLALLSQQIDKPIPAVGTTTFRAPYTPVTFGALAGEATGHDIAPLRRSALHDSHVALGARFVNAGYWQRPLCYPRPGESEADALKREAITVRHAVGMQDVSTLGKIDLKGKDVAEFLERIYSNRWSSLAVGKVRYGVMLREDGIVMDDGTTARLGEHHYLMTTTTLNAARVQSHLEFWLQTAWRDLDVHVTGVTEHWAAIALAGPRSRDVLAELAPDADWSNDALPAMGYRADTLAGVTVRIFRISFSGELAYEINVPADYAEHVWKALLNAGNRFGITPYGTDAMNAMRVEKGHITGMELDGRTSPHDLGLGALVKNTRDFIGARSLQRPGFTDPQRKQLIGLEPVDGKTLIPRGAQIVAAPNAPRPTPILGHVTSTSFSFTLNKPIALALLAGGRERIGETLYIDAPLVGVTTAVRVVPSVFFDPEGARARG